VCVCPSLSLILTLHVFLLAIILALLSVSFQYVCVCALLISVKYGMIAYFLAIVWISMMKYEICICREAETYINIFV